VAETTAARLKDALHRNPATSRAGLLERLFTLWFRGFVYNQIWEDPRVDAEALRLDETSRLLTISSAGCNVLNYLVHRPARVVAVDLNESHMALTRLKLAGLRHLPDYETFFRFFGEAQSASNVAAYHRHLRPHLDARTRAHWEGTPYPMGLGRPRIHYFETGLYERGKLGLFFRLVRLLARTLLGRCPSDLLEATTRAEQERFFDEAVAPFFDHPLVRRLGKTPTAVYCLGIPPVQHQIMRDESGDLIASYRMRLKKLVCGFPLEDNYFAWQAFGMRYDPARRAVPDYLKAEHYALLRYALDAVETHVTSLGRFLAQQPAASFDSFVLLDAMDWMSDAEMAALWAEIARAGAPGARVVFRTAGFRSPIETALAPDVRRRFTYERPLSERLHTQDRSAIYGMLHVYTLAS
jgi:S-adenosylmethionine-diacylglycerol 3-amino-3-carboxypropyl transferase